MKKHLISKLLIIFLISTTFSFIMINNTNATNLETENSATVSNEEEQILEYDAITGKTTVVDMEELQKSISLCDKNSNIATNTIPGQSITFPKFKSPFMTMMSDPGYETRALRITDTTQFPYRSVLKVSFDGGSGTASLIAPKGALTAAHVIFNEDNEPFANWTCYVAFNNWSYQGIPTGWSKVYFSSKWKSTHDKQYDWAICVLETDYSYTTSSFGVSACSDGDLQDLGVTCLGYPSESKYLYNGLEQYSTGYKIKSVGTYHFMYGGYTVGGFSGAPIISDVTGSIIGVHFGSNKTFEGYGVRVTQEMIDIMKNIRAL